MPPKPGRGPRRSSRCPGPTCYGPALATALALVVCYAGEVDEAALDTALDLLRSDECLADPPSAVERFSAAVEALGADGAKSSVSFKLRVGKLLAEIRPVADGHLRERVATMPERTVEALPSDRRQGTAAMLARISAALNAPT
jgi:hypothetical protein